MKRISVFVYCSLVLIVLLLNQCSGAKKRQEQRILKFEQTKKELFQQQTTIHYIDSALVHLSQTADSLLPYFKYTKDEKYLNNGFYVHKNLQTNLNYLRNFIQVRLTDNYDLILKSYYVGDFPLNASSFILSYNDNYVSCPCNLHAFQEENYHEILTPDFENAKNALIFINNALTERLSVELQGEKRKFKYYLTKQDKEALQCSYHMFITMQDIHKLEKERNKSSKLVELYSKRLQKDSINAFSKK